MSLIKIKSGNSFPLICTLKDNGNPVNPANVEGLKVFLKRENMGSQPVEYSIEDEVLRIHVTPTLANIAGVYRIVITGTYLGESVNRDPIAFEIVNNVEKESKGGSIKQADVYMDIEFFVGSIKVGSGASNWDDIQGKPSFSAVASSGDYNDLENRPFIPARLSDLEDGNVVENMGRAFGEEIERVDGSIEALRVGLVRMNLPEFEDGTSPLMNAVYNAEEAHHRAMENSQTINVLFGEDTQGETYGRILRSNVETLIERVDNMPDPELLIGSHNNSNTSHSDIRDLASGAEAIAKGKSRATVFGTEVELDDFLNDSKNLSTLRVGDNLYIRDLDAPDYWWDGEQKQVLGSEKVDLTGLTTEAAANGKYVPINPSDSYVQNVNALKMSGSVNSYIYDRNGYPIAVSSGVSGLGIGNFLTPFQIGSKNRPVVALEGDERYEMAFLSDIESAIGNIASILDSINREAV